MVLYRQSYVPGDLAAASSTGTLVNLDNWRGEMGKLFMVVLVTLLGELKAIRARADTSPWESQKDQRI